MAELINRLPIRSGRLAREDNTIVNEATGLDDQGRRYVRQAPSMTLLTTHQSGATANGDGVVADVEGYSSATFQISGTFSATVNFECSVDGVLFVPLFVIDANGNRVASTTAQGVFRADIAGLKSIRARVSSYVSGAVTVISRALPVARPVEQSVSLYGRKATLSSVSYDQALNVSPSGITTISITPPVGELWRVKGLYMAIDAPIGATSGTHELLIHIGMADAAYRRLSLGNAYNGNLEIIDNRISTAATKIPTTEDAQQRAILHLVVTNSLPLTILYINSTNATQTGTLKVHVQREVEYLVS